MSRFVQRAVERLDLGDGDWVDLRSRLTYGDRSAVQVKLLGRIPVDADGRINPAGREIDLAAGNIELMRLAIVEWGGPGFCSLDHAHDNGSPCAPMPITAESIASLDETGERILEELRKRMVTRSPDFKSPPSPSPREGGDTSSTATESLVSSSASSSDGLGRSSWRPLKTS